MPQQTLLILYTWLLKVNIVPTKRKTDMFENFKQKSKFQTFLVNGSFIFPITLLTVPFHPAVHHVLLREADSDSILTRKYAGLYFSINGFAP